MTRTNGWSLRMHLKKHRYVSFMRRLKRPNEDIERFSFNTAISQFMICVNELRKSEERSAEILSPLVQLISPFAPFVAEELWQQLGGEGSVHTSVFPQHDEKWLINTSINYPVCINGKKRSELILAAGTSNQEIEANAKALPEIIKWLEGQSIKKVIIIPDKMVNIVI